MSKKLLITFFFLAITCTARAENITILYSGETHAMLYPCSCPIERDGGIARRATLIKEIRKDTPDALVVDSGAFFAGGLMDEYTQNTALDMQRSRINLEAMELAQYDAVNIADDEFNFGRRFLEESIAKARLHFVCANIKSAKISPYIVKEIKGIKIGIIGVAALSTQKAEGLEVIDPKQAVKEAVGQLQRKGVKLILLLSRLSEGLDLKSILDIEGIDVIITNQPPTKGEVSVKTEKAIILRPSWQGRRLGRLSLTIENGRITQYKTEELRLSDKISDDPGIQHILPQCFSDAGCKKGDLVGVCSNPGVKEARCIFKEPQKVNLLVIVPKVCNVCQPQVIIRRLKSYFPGLQVSYLYYPDTRAKKFIKDLDLKSLPAYLLGRKIEKEKNFDKLKENLISKGKFYVVATSFSGISYLLERPRLKGKLDLMLSLYDKNATQLLRTIREFNPDIHFLAIEKDGGFDAAQGKAEVEEYLRAVCVRKYYPQVFFDYIICRSQNINSSWWEDCLSQVNAAKIKACARSQEARDILRENIKLDKELYVMFGPAYLVDNQEIFSTQGVPKKEEFKKIFNRE
jgi:5'-nucleotidase